MIEPETIRRTAIGSGIVGTLAALVVTVAAPTASSLAGATATPIPNAGPTRMQPSAAGSAYTGPDVCRPCHEEIYRSAVETSHFRDSTAATARTTMGSFQEGENELATNRPDRYLVMERRDGELRQTLVERDGDRQIVIRSEPFDIVVGSTKGQTYLYWRNGLLFQLPVSWLASVDDWIYSPGYEEGRAHFDRLITPACLDCHSTFFPVESEAYVEETDDYLLGITCEKCHGPGRDHVEYHREHPEADEPEAMVEIDGLGVRRQIDNCARCHSGATLGDHLRPTFSYRPGDPLEEYFRIQEPQLASAPQVHSNQVALLRASRCFRESASMTCSTCHDLHVHERGDVARFSGRCLDCHAPGGHLPVDADRPLADNCIDCHMPLQPASAVYVERRGRQFGIPVRTHLIDVYPETAPPGVEE